MINLLPNETKKQIRAARTNVILINFVVYVSIAIAFLAAACAVTYFFINNSKTIAEKSNQTVSQTTTDAYNLAKSQANAINLSLTSAKTILDKQISYSSIITGIGAALPNGVIIDSLSLSNSTIGKPMVLRLLSRSASNETLITENLQKSSLFSNVTVQSTENVEGDTSGYPVVFNINLIINKVAI